MGDSKPLSILGRLRSVLVGRLAELGYDVVEEHPDHLVIHINDQPHSIYLSNLARALELGLQAKPGKAAPTQLSDSDLRQAIDEWLTVHLRQIPTRQALEESCRELHEVRDKLLPRLMAPAGPAAPGQRWSRTLCEDYIDLSLVIDQPDIVTFATPEMVAGWGVEHAEAHAMGNLRKLVKKDDFRPLSEVGQLRMCATSDSYAASRALMVEELLADEGGDGVLLAMPSRDLLFAEPLAADSVQDLVYLALLARKSVSELPYPLSGEVFWVRGSNWQHVPIRIEDGQMNVEASEEFGEVIKRLMGED